MKRSMIRNLVAVTLLSASALYAQSSQKVQANIPFDFQVGSKALAAGTYSVRQLNDSSHMLLIENRQHVKVNAIARPRTTEASDARPKLVFSRYGDQYILSQVCNGDGCANMPKQRVEREWALAMAPEMVTVFAGLP
ncbi:MAG: hypothetical protein NVS9B15_06710 [Acidobacteriaceae bacterium]